MDNFYLCKDLNWGPQAWETMISLKSDHIQKVMDNMVGNHIIRRSTRFLSVFYITRFRPAHIRPALPVCHVATPT